MRSRRHLGLIAAAATLLASAPLTTIFQQWTWLIQTFVVVGLIAGIGVLTRTLRAPLWAQVLSMAVGLLLALSWMFPSGQELLAIIPTSTTFAHFGELLSGAVQDMRSLAVPVGDTDPLLFLTVLGVSTVAIAVDFCAVGLRRPALAGLPMLAIYSVPVAVFTEAVHPLPFIVGAAGFLWLLVADSVDRVRRFGHRYTGDGRDVDVWEPSPLAAAGRRLAVVGVVVAVLLPVAVPGMTGGLLDRLNQSTGIGEGRGIGGGPGRINLFAALSGQLRQTEVTELVKVTTNEPEPFYLRFGVADVIRDDGFGIRNPSGRSVNRGGLPDPRQGPRPGVTQQQYQARVEITGPFDMPLLPIYTEPLSMNDVESNWLYDDSMQIVFSNRNGAKGKKYSFDYVRSTYTPRALNEAESLAPDDPIRRGYTSVPKVKEVDDLVRRLVAGEQTEYAKVRAIYDYFSRDNEFAYSLEAEGGTDGPDIVAFLKRKSGFCQQYAAAMAWMVRAAGIPARVAFGFTNGSDQDGETYRLTNKNLHAWTEVYFAGLGWVPFDATPAASVAGSARSAWAPDTDAPDPTAPTAAPSAGVAGGPSNDALDRGREPANEPGEATPAGSGQRQQPTWPLWAMAALGLLVALLATPALLRALLRRRRGRLAAPAVSTANIGEPAPGEVRVLPAAGAAARHRAEAHAAWDELIDTLIDFRVRVDPTETPRMTAERLAADRVVGGDGASAARLLGRAEERARYARDPLVGQQLGRAVRVFRKDLAGVTPWRRRAAAALLPPSVLERWRFAIVETATQIVTAGGRAREQLLRWNPRRLIATRAR